MKITEYVCGRYEEVSLREAVKKSITVENLADTFAKLVEFLHTNDALTDRNIQDLINFDKYNIRDTDHEPRTY